MNKSVRNWLIVLGLAFVGTTAWASIQGDLLNVGIDVSGPNIIAFGAPFQARRLGITDYDTTGTAKTLVPNDAGTIWETTAASHDDPVTFNLPAGASLHKGAIFTFIDGDATAAADLTINPADADAINAQSAGVSLNATGDAVGEAITLIWTGARWITLTKTGTWTQGS